MDKVTDPARMSVEDITTPIDIAPLESAPAFMRHAATAAGVLAIVAAVYAAVLAGRGVL